MNKTFPYAALAVPSIVLALGAAGLLSGLPWLYAAAAAMGVATIAADSVREIRHGRYSLDYIAFLAMAVGLSSGEYAAAAIVALMFTGGKALEAFAGGRAESSLRALLDRIPKNVLVSQSGGTVKEIPLAEAREGDVITVRPNELVPLDGTLVSETGTFNTANLTGEAMPVTVERGSPVKSGVVAVSETVLISVTGTFETSTYARIVDLVREAKQNEAPLVRAAGQANLPFTVVTLAIAGATFALTRDPSRLLAVLVLATPCPLIIAAPVAFIGGMSRAASRNIIVKKPGLLETLAGADTVFFDKTGTLTLGTPELSSVTADESETGADGALRTAASIEFHSIHPLARAFVSAAAKRGLGLLPAADVSETVGTGISGTVSGKAFRISQDPDRSGGGISLVMESDGAIVARFSFADTPKEGTADVIRKIAGKGISVGIITGDTAENACAVFGDLPVKIHADCSPEDKYRIIDEAKRLGTVVMVGDGLNDAPALARAHAGVVFSGTENSAAIEAAGVVILGSEIAKVSELFETSRRSLRIARQSIWIGIGLSVAGMAVAAFGFIPPVAGAFMQEAIDVSVILNSLRTVRKQKTP